MITMNELPAMPRTGGWAGLVSVLVAWRARRLLSRGAVVVDTETTGLGPAAEIVEIAVVDARTETIVVESLVRPVGSIDPEAIAVHGITAEMVATAPTWSTVWLQVQKALAGHPVVAFNAPFDHGRVAADCTRYGFRKPRRRWICLMRLDARQHGGQWRRLDGGHRAAGDALAAARLLRRIAGSTSNGGGHR